MKKFFRIVLFGLLAAALAAALVLLGGYLLSLHDSEPAVVPGIAELTPASGVTVGGDITASTEFDLPLWRRVVRAAAAPADGVAAVGSPRIASAWRWSKRRWRVEVPMRPYRSGTTAPGALTIEMSPSVSGGTPETAEVVIPDFAVGEGTGADDGGLRLAGAEDVTQSTKLHYLWLIPAALLLVIAGVMISRIRRRVKAAAIPLWQRTLADLADLKSHIDSDRIAPEAGFARLTDLVRNYLEKRFRLRVTTKTTPEFLIDLDREEKLPAAHRPFLREFLNSADQIKFALAPADRKFADEAIDRAAELVRSTVPEEDVSRGRQEK